MAKDYEGQLSRELLYLYNTGKCYYAYRSFGAHIEGDGVRFTVWVPDAKSVRVVGDFNDWSGNDYLNTIEDTGVWTGIVPCAAAGDFYKYDIETADGRHLMKADPFAFGAELRPGTASAVTDLSYIWNDDAWMKARSERNLFTSPVNIYEVHLGSWRCHPVDGYYTYRDLAETLVPYVREMGYTHIEMMPVTEHPLDASWGYQVTGYYAVTSRYGSPEDFKYLVDRCHEEGIGVILDWVPGHFCPDAHGLAEFNGSKLYESEIHPDWGTYKFDFGRPQVRSFLLSNAMFWADEFHADGIRVDGVSSMLYLNFGVSDPAKKKYNRFGEDGNLEAIDFLRELNAMMGTYCPGVVTCAEESTAWPLVTMPPEDGGLGFHFKWNMGWMNDTLEYMSTDFPYREAEHNKLTFSMAYAYSENYILPLSHDEVVHGKRSLIGRMPGDIWRQFAGVRLLALYQMTHPGKKLNFMGTEFAQFIEWREYEELEWFMLDYPNHAAFHEYIRALNRFYLDTPALWQKDHNPDGFSWIDADNRKQGVLVYARFAGAASSTDDPMQTLVIALNTGVQSYDKFRIGVPSEGVYELAFDSDAEAYGGSGWCTADSDTDDGTEKTITAEAEKIPMHGREYSIEVRVPAIGGVIYRRLR